MAAPHDEVSARAGPLMTGLSSVRTSPKWSMQGRWQSARVQGAADTPGPGSYSSDGFQETSRFGRAARFVFGSSTRDGFSMTKGIPGPGSYTPRDGAVEQVPPSWGFGTSLRNQLSKERTTVPGPGTYTHPSSVGAAGGPQYTATPRRAYQVGVGSGPSGAAPGPGAYGGAAAGKEAVTLASPRWGFGTSQRQPLSGAGQAPGPGAYVQTNTLGKYSPKYSMGARRNILGDSKDTPGPGAHGGAFTQFGY